MTEKPLSRRAARENAFLAAFSATFQPDEAPCVPVVEDNADHAPLDEFASRLLADCNAHREQIDELIVSHLKGWTLSRLPRVSLTAMRIALAEMLYGDEKKAGVAINEAVELVKKYGADNDHQFVNGLLGAVAREQGLSPESETKPC